MAKNLSKDLEKSHYYGTGRRKSSVARVFLRFGSGEIKINNFKLEDYFDRKTAHRIVYLPLEVVDVKDKFNIHITVKGGGKAGQAGAIQLGIARALVYYDESTTFTETEKTKEINEGEESGSSSNGGSAVNSFRRLLRAKGLLTRDARIVERKKVGHRKARKVEQFSKR